MSIMKLLTKTIPNTGSAPHTATVIFFHGSGDTGSNVVEWIRFLLGKDMQFPHIKFIFPTAPLQPYTPLNGEKSNVWFDRKTITIEAQESRKSLATMYESVNELLVAEQSAGIPLNRIIVGGFSMGGALALHTGYHITTELAGVFACSSFLNRDSIVYESLKSKNHKKLPNLYQFHGDRDTLVPPQWGTETFSELQKLGVSGEFVTLRNTMHELKTKELLLLQEWIGKLLPAVEEGQATKPTGLSNKL